MYVRMCREVPSYVCMCREVPAMYVCVERYQLCMYVCVERTEIYLSLLFSLSRSETAVTEYPCCVPRPPAHLQNRNKYQI